MGQPELSGSLMRMMIWSICTSDSSGTEVSHQTAQACDKLALLGSAPNLRTAQPAPGETPQPRVADRTGKVTPVAAVRSLPPVHQEKIAAATPARQ